MLRTCRFFRERRCNTVSHPLCVMLIRGSFTRSHPVKRMKKEDERGVNEGRVRSGMREREKVVEQLSS